MNILKLVFGAAAGVTSLFSTALFAGSVSGGGGGTVVANPVGNAAIESILRGARGPLLMYFRQLDSGDQRFIGENERRLFYASPTVYDLIDTTPIEALSSAACKDLDGNDVDGSIVSSTPNGICISLQRIGAKLDRTNAFSQTIALVAHELSHKLGFDENDAEQLQKDMLYRLEEGSVSYNAASDYARHISETASGAASATDWFINFADLNDWNQSCQNARWLQDQYKRLEDAIYDGPLSLNVVPRKSMSHFEFGTKVFGIRAASCGRANPPLRDHMDEYVFAEYSAAFGGQTEISVYDFSSAMWGGAIERENSEMKIRFIETGLIAKSESMEVREFLHRLGEIAADLSKPSLVVVKQ